MKTHLLSYLARYLTIWLFLTSGMGALGQSKLLYPLEFGSEGIRLTTLSNLGLGSSSEVTFDTLNLGTDLNVQGSAIFTTATFSSNISVSGSASFHGDVSILDGISISDAGARRSLRDSLEVSGTLYVSNLTSGSSSLKSVTTTDKAVGRIYLVKSAGVFYVFALEESTHEEEGLNWIRPNDYNASTNAKVWRQLALFAPFLNVTNLSASGDASIGGSLLLGSNEPEIELHEADASSHEKNWRFSINGGVMRLSLVDDNDESFKDIISIDRTGATSATWSWGSGITVDLPSGTVQTADIAGNAVDNSKLATMSANTVKGRLSTSGAVQDISLSTLKSAMGLGNVDNTSDADKPVSTKQGLAISERERSGYLVSDGSPAGRAAGIWRFGDDGDVAGQAITIPFEFDVPTSNPSGHAFIAKFASSVSSEFENNGLTLRISTAGNLVLLATGATYASDQRVFNYPSWRAAYSGQHVRGVAIVNPGTSTPVIVINGVDISGSFSATTTGTAPNWMDESLSTTYYLAGHNWPAGRFWPHAPILGAVSVNDAIEWTRGGNWPDWVYRGGSAVPRYTSNFSSSSDGWAVSNLLGLGTVTGNNDGVGGYDDVAKFTAGVGVAGSYAIYKMTQPPGINQRIVMQVYIPSASTTITGIRLFSRNNVSNATFYQGLEKDTWHTLEHISGVSANAISGELNFAFSPINASGEVVFDALGQELYFRQVVVTDLGSLALPRVQPILALDDRLSRYGARVLGFTPVTFGDSRWRVIGNTATNGNEQILGGAVFGDYESVVINDVVMTCANSNTVTLGSSSGGAQYKTSGALTPGTNVISLVTRRPASNSFWVGSDNAYPIRTWITGHMAGMHVSVP